MPPYVQLMGSSPCTSSNCLRYVPLLCWLQEEEEEEDPVDPREELDEKCGNTLKCSKLQSVLDECTDRVNSKTSTTETCTQELFDFLHCVDHCVSCGASIQDVCMLCIDIRGKYNRCVQCSGILSV